MNQIVKLKRRGPAAPPQDSQGLVIASPQAVAMAPPPSSTERLFEFIGRAITDASIPADKLEIIIRLEREMVVDQRRLAYQASMSAAQSEMVPVVRDSPNTATNSRFAKLEKIDAAIRPIYTRHGFFLSYNEEITDKADRIITCKIAAHGHEEIHRLSAPLDMFGPKGLPNKTPLHGLGSTVSYLRRYLTCMIFNVILTGDDNDGNNRVQYDPPPDGELITGQQAAELYSLLRQCSASPLAEAERTALTKMGLSHLRSLKDLPAGEPHARVRRTLAHKAARIRERNILAGDVK